MTSTHRTLQTRTGAYVDSVTLMQVSKRVASLDGVTAALVAMATELNLDLAAGMGFEVPDGLTPQQMLVALEAADAATLDAALAEVDAALTEAARPQPTGFGSAPPSATLGAAARRVDAGSVALVSTPGSTRSPTRSTRSPPGGHVMIFSDNVPARPGGRAQGVRRPPPGCW